MGIKNTWAIIISLEVYLTASCFCEPCVNLKVIIVHTASANIDWQLWPSRGIAFKGQLGHRWLYMAEAKETERTWGNKHTQSAFHVRSSVSVDSTQCGLKIFGKKNSREFQKAKLLLHQKLLHSIYIILGITSNLEMSSSVWEDVCRLYANILSFFIRNLRSRTNPPWLWRHNCNFKNEKAYTWYFLWYTIVLNAKTKQNILSCRYISYHPK